MKYNIRKWNPIFIGIPDIGIGMYWTALGSVVAFFAYKYTESSADVAKIFSIAALMGVITQVVVGILSDKTKHKWGKRSPWLVYGMILAGLSQMLWVFAPNFIVLLIISGFTFTMVNIAQCAYYTMVMEVVDKDQIGYANTVARTTACLGALAMSSMAAYIWNKDLPIITFAIMAAILIIPTVLIVPTVVKERPENYSTQPKMSFGFGFLKHPEVIKLYTATFFCFAAHTGIGNMGAPLFVKNLHFSEHVFSQALMWQTVANLIFGFLAFKIVDIYSRKYIMAFAMLFLAIFTGVALFILEDGVSSYYLWGFMFFYGLAWLAGNICMYTLLSMVSPKESLGEFMGWLNVFIALPQFIFANIYGYILDAGHMNWVFIIVSASFIIAFIVVCSMKVPHHKSLVTTNG